jgi:hypothetical protein
LAECQRFLIFMSQNYKTEVTEKLQNLIRNFWVTKIG